MESLKQALHETEIFPPPTENRRQQLMNTRHSNQLEVLPKSDEEKRLHYETMLTVVADAANSSSMLLTLIEKAAMAKTWSRILLPIIPEDRLLDALDRAIDDHQTSFAVNSYDLKLAYEKICAEERAELEKYRASDAENKPWLNCGQKKYHIPNTEGLALVYSQNLKQDVPVPCVHCRTDDFDKWKKNDIALYGEHRAVDIFQKSSNVFCADKSEKEAEIYLAPDEAESLREKHNRLVRELAPPEAWKDLEIVFDEGANVFKLPHRADLLFSPSIVRTKIADYQRFTAEVDREI